MSTELVNTVLKKEHENIADCMIDKVRYLLSKPGMEINNYTVKPNYYGDCIEELCLTDNKGLFIEVRVKDKIVK